MTVKRELSDRVVIEPSHHGGKIQFRGTDNECFAALLGLQSNSTDRAMRVEGWRVTDAHKVELEELVEYLDRKSADVRFSVTDESVRNFNAFLKAYSDGREAPGQELRQDALNFVARATPLLKEAIAEGYSWVQAGADFGLSRAGQAGFCEHVPGELGRQLAELAGEHQPVPGVA